METNTNSNIPYIAKIMENIRKVIEEDRAQKQPLILKIKEGFIFDIAKKAISEKDYSFLVSIAGESASGKTTLVNNAAKACIKKNADKFYSVVCCDDYYKDASRELQEAGSYEELFKTGFSFDTPDAIDIAKMREHLVALKSGQEIHSPDYNFVTCESKPDGALKIPAKLILNEGLYVLDESLRDIIDVKVYVYTPFEVIKDRWYKRAITRGKTGAAADMQFNDVNQTAFRYIRPTMQLADVVINGLTSQEYIEEVAQKFIEAVRSATRN